MSTNDKAARARLLQLIFFEASAPFRNNGYLQEEFDILWRQRRDYAVQAVTRRTRPVEISNYEDCTNSELAAVLKYLKSSLSESELPDKVWPKSTPATAAQRAKLHNVAQRCAIEFCDLQGAELIIESTGEVIADEAIRPLLRRIFEDKALSGGLQQMLYVKWINPHLHKYLIEGGFKKYQPKNPEYFRWSELKSDEAQYLIVRFNRIIDQINVRSSPEDQRAVQDNISRLRRTFEQQFSNN